MSTKMLRLNFSLPPQTVDRVRTESDSQGITVSEVARRALDDFLNRQEDARLNRQLLRTKASTQQREPATA